MSQEPEKSNGSRNRCLYTSNFSKFQGLPLPSRRTRIQRSNFGRDHPMKRCIAINDHDEAFVDRIVAINSDPSDQ